MHRLKGSAGLFGLRRVSALAEEVEAAARSEAGLVERLAAAVTATREKLAGDGLLAG
jgi:HPt (histidine-containing phosphotransfer) domain-containing protein